MDSGNEPKYRKIQLRVSEFEWRKFKELEAKGISARKSLEYSGKPCDCCKGIVVSIFNNDGEQVLIPKGLLSSKK